MNAQDQFGFSSPTSPARARKLTKLTRSLWRSSQLRHLSSYRRAVPTVLYNRDILRLAAAIPDLGRLAAPHGSAEKSSPVCGSRVAVDVTLDGEGRIAGLGQEVKACALGQASAALMSAHARGRRAGDLDVARAALADWLAGRREDPGDWPGLDIFAEARRVPARHAAILLAFEAAAEAARAAQTARVG